MGVEKLVLCGDENGWVLLEVLSFFPHPLYCHL